MNEEQSAIQYNELCRQAPDAERIKKLNELSLSVSFYNPAQALAFAEEALSWAEAIGDEAGKARSMWSIGKCLMDFNRDEEGLAHLEAALEIAENLGANVFIANICMGIGNFHATRHSYRLALEWYFRATAIWKYLGNYRTVDSLAGNIAYIFARIGDFREAMTWAVEGLKWERNNAPTEVCRSLNGIGDLYFAYGEYARATECFLQSEEIAFREGLSRRFPWIQTNIGSIYAAVGNITTALDYSLRSIQSSELRKDDDYLAHCYREVGELYGKLGNTLVALEYLNQSLALNRSLRNPFGEADALMAMAVLCKNSGNPEKAMQYAKESARIFQSLEAALKYAESLCLLAELESDAISALEYAIKGAESAKKIGIKALHLRSARILADVYRRLGNISEALHHEAEAESAEQSVFPPEERTRVKDLLLGYELAKERRETMPLGNISPLSEELFAKAALYASSTETAANEQKIQVPVVITTLGSFSVSIGKRLLSESDWKRKKARDIFKILLIHYRSALSQEELIELAWQDSQGKNLVPTLWNSISYIRKALEPDLKPQQSSSFLKNTDKSYFLDFGDNAHIDFLHLKEYIHKAQTSTGAERETLLRKALDMRKGDFLPDDTDAPWLQSERATLNAYIREAEHILRQEKKLG